MPWQDLVHSLFYYTYFILFGLIGFAIFAPFTKNKTLAFLVAKPIGLLAFTYPLWILSSVKLFDFNINLLIQFLFGISIIIAIFFIITKNKEYYSLEKKKVLLIILIELASLLMYTMYLIVKSYKPDILDTEKFMDIAMLTSAGKTNYFPFIDFWWAGESVNYYYFGYVLFAIPIKLLNIPWAVGYNLSLAIIFIQCFILGASIIYKIKNSIFLVLFGASILTFGGNLHYTSCIINKVNEQNTVAKQTTNPTQVIEKTSVISIEDLKLKFDITEFQSKWKDLTYGCFYPKATRIYPTSYTINEMPSYSFILGDLHPHVLSIPYFLLGIFLILLIAEKRELLDPLHLFFLFIASCAASINVWDFMTLGAIYGIVNLLIMYFKFRDMKDHKYSLFSTEIKIPNNIKNNLLLGFGITALVAISPFLVFLLYFQNFKSPVTGVGFAPEYIKNAIDYNRLGSEASSGTVTPTHLVAPILELNDKYSIAQYPSNPEFLFGLWGTFLILFLVSILFILVIRRQSLFDIKTFFALLLFIAGLGLIIFTELFFMRDLFHIVNPAYFRANTVFKLTFHAWMLFSLALLPLLGVAWDAIKSIKFVYLKLFSGASLIILVSICFTIMLSYSFFGYAQAYNLVNTDTSKKELTIDGSKFLERLYEADYKTINWLNENEKERIVIVEAVGGAYTKFGRIGVFTGNINITNWETHQLTWRFSYPDGVTDWKKALKENSRAPVSSETTALKQEVENIYTVVNLDAAKTTLKRVNAKYIYVGVLEKDQYANIDEDKIKEFLASEIAFQTEWGTLYRVNSNL